MNPVIVVPTYISGRHQKENKPILQTYDHMDPMSKTDNLLRCLRSINAMQGDVPVIVLVVSDLGLDNQAANAVQLTVNKVPQLQTLVVGAPELSLVQQRLEQLGIGSKTLEIGLTSYGSIRNLGLVVSAVFGFDAVVFVDDDEVIEDPEFLKKAVYGLGKFTSKGIPIIAKSGYFLDAEGSWLSKANTEWYDKQWDQGKAFNKWITKAMNGPRLSRSNVACGGCLALHKEAFKRLSFDPWIARGEDLDYMLNLRMYGSTVWFDNQWNLRHLPPETESEGTRFRQDIYRWLYEFRKIEYSRTQIDLMQIKPSALMPYPGPFLEPGVQRRIKQTARLRSLACNDKRAYSKAAAAASNEAAEYAAENCTNYFEFQSIWPKIMDRLDGDLVLRTALVQSTALRKGIDLGEIDMEQAVADEAAQQANVAAAAAAAAVANLAEQAQAAAEEHAAVGAGAAGVAGAAGADAAVAAGAGAAAGAAGMAGEAAGHAKRAKKNAGFKKGSTQEIMPVSVFPEFANEELDLDDAAGIWAAAEAAATQGTSGEGGLRPREFDPGLTSEIRLNLQD